MPNTISAGRIVGNPLCGLCERVCISVKRITDGCLSRLTDITFDNLPLSVLGVGYNPPYVFISAENTAEPQIANLAVSPLSHNKIRVSYDAVFPVTVTFSDANGLVFTGTTSVSVPRDVVLTAPPVDRTYSVEAVGKLLSRIGVVNANLTVTITCCIAIITRLVVNADILVPTYGECVYPDCVGYADGLCTAVFNTPPFTN